MSASVTPVAAAASELVTVESGPTAVRITARGCLTSVDTEHLMSVIREFCRASAPRVVVDLNGVTELDGAVIERIVAMRGQAGDSVIAIDIARLHGPLVAALLARVLDPDAPPARRTGGG